MEWIFGPNGIAGPEGLGDGNLETFKGDPMKSLAREICQNSLDACRDKDEPVTVEFMLYDVAVGSFPGLSELGDIVEKCEEYWEKDKNKKTKAFFRDAKRALNSEKIKVLRISDYNTKGLLGAFDKENVLNSWTGLVTGSSMSVKEDENAGGSYGIGKNAPFVNSYLQTVFYRTYAQDETCATQGVAHLASFIDERYPEKEQLRRSLGFFADENGEPLVSIPQLDAIYNRTEYGTDLFIPAFKVEDDWVTRMSAEIMDNFLMSIYDGKLEVKIGSYGAVGNDITKESMNKIIARCEKEIKEARGFAEVLRADKSEIEEVERDFFGMGKLRIRLLFGKKDLNQKILVVRSSGMKIAEVPRLPRQISFSGILELVGDDINAFFRGMETPQHDKWEPKRHPDDPKDARNKKTELENWVLQIIEKKVLERVGDTTEIESFDFFNSSHDDARLESDDEGNSLIEKNTTYDFDDRPVATKNYESTGKRGNNATKGFVDPEGDATGFRHKTGSKGVSPVGRKAIINPLGPDSVNAGMRKVAYRARVIKDAKSADKLFLSTAEPIKDALVEIVTVGENGKAVPLKVTEAFCDAANVYCKNGKIYIDSLESDEKIRIQFKLEEERNFALGVKVYGNKE